MGFTYKLFKNVGANLLGTIIAVLSPELRQLLEEMVKTLYKKALSTPNPVDDMFVELLAELLKIDLNE